MTAILTACEYRNTANTATIKIEKYFDKFSAPLWRVVLVPDLAPLARVLVEGLQNKPNKSRISAICANF